MKTKTETLTNPALPRRLCIVSETYAPETNGVATTLRNLVAELSRLGVDIDIVAPHHPARSRPATAGRLYPVQGVPVPGYAAVRAGLVRPHLIRDLWRKTQPDAIYIATEGPLGWSALRAAHQLQIPVVSGYHTRFDAYADHYLGGLLRPLVAAALRRFHNATATTLVPDDDLARQLRQNGYRRVETLGRGVDTALFSPERRCAQLREAWNAGPDAPVLLSVGRVAAEKNLELALEAYERIRAVKPRARLVLVGDGPARPALQRAHPEVIFAGSRRGTDLARFYASADLFLFPSRTETFGNVTLEALASGLPVIAFDYASAHRYVSDGVNGVKAPFEDPGAWVTAAVGTALLPPHRLRLWREAAPESVHHLSWSAIARHFAAVLASAEHVSDPQVPEVAACNRP